MVNGHHQGIGLDDFPELDNCLGFASVGEFEVLEALGKVKSKSVGIDGISIHCIMFSKSACKLMLSSLSGRSQFVALNGVQSGLICLILRVPQGSVVSPLLFIFYCNDLFLATNSKVC